jgi:hypothetical protein
MGEITDVRVAEPSARSCCSDGPSERWPRHLGPRPGQRDRVPFREALSMVLIDSHWEPVPEPKDPRDRLARFVQVSDRMGDPLPAARRAAAALT